MKYDVFSFLNTRGIYIDNQDDYRRIISKIELQPGATTIHDGTTRITCYDSYSRAIRFYIEKAKGTDHKKYHIKSMEYFYDDSLFSIEINELEVIIRYFDATAVEYGKNTLRVILKYEDLIDLGIMPDIKATINIQDLVDMIYGKTENTYSIINSFILKTKKEAKTRSRSNSEKLPFEI